MITDYGEERQRSLILDYFGNDARIRVLRRAEIFGAAIFVVDFDRGPRNFRTLGSFGAGAQVTEQSSMDLLYPSRLVFHYERLMSLAFAMSARSINALLLGVGRRSDVALYARLSAGLRADPRRLRTRPSRDCPPVVLPEAAGRARHGAAISRRVERALRRDPRRSVRSRRPRRERRGFLDALPRRARARRLSRQQLGRFRSQPQGPADGRRALRRGAGPRSSSRST